MRISSGPLAGKKCPELQMQAVRITDIQCNHSSHNYLRNGPNDTFMPQPNWSWMVQITQINGTRLLLVIWGSTSMLSKWSNMGGRSSGDDQFLLIKQQEDHKTWPFGRAVRVFQFCRPFLSPLKLAVPTPHSVLEYSIWVKLRPFFNNLESWLVLDDWWAEWRGRVG